MCTEWKIDRTETFLARTFSIKCNIIIHAQSCDNNVLARRRTSGGAAILHIRRESWEETNARERN